jgi:hypothetical protein
LKNALAYVQQRCCQQKFASQIIARLGQKIEEGKQCGGVSQNEK